MLNGADDRCPIVVADVYVGHLQGVVAKVAVAADPLDLVQQVALFADRQEVLGQQLLKLVRAASQLSVAESGHHLQELIHALHRANPYGRQNIGGMTSLGMMT